MTTLKNNIKIIDVTDDNISETGVYCIKDKKSAGCRAKVDWFRSNLIVVLFTTVILLVGLALGLKVFQYVRWGILIAVGAVSMIMIGFNAFMYGMMISVVVLIVLGRFLPAEFEWKKGLAVILVAVIAFSFHLFIPIRSAQNPRIDENDVAKDEFTMGFFISIPNAIFLPNFIKI